MKRLVRCAASLTPLFLVAVSCTGSSSFVAGAGRPPHPVGENAVFGAGTDLLEGFVVAEGSWLLGSPFPRRLQIDRGIPPAQRPTDRQPSEWTALISLSDEAQSVVERYLEQAERLGYRIERRPCSDVRGKALCGGEAVRPEGAAGGRFQILTALGPDEVVYGVVFSDLVPVEGGSPTSRVVQAPAPAALEGLPHVGDSLGGISHPPAIAPYDEPIDFTLLDGWALVAPVVLLELGGPVQYAVLRHRGGSPGVSDYADQLPDTFTTRIDRPAGKIDGIAFSGQHAGCPGACGDVEFSMAESAGQAFLLIEATPTS